MTNMMKNDQPSNSKMTQNSNDFATSDNKIVNMSDYQSATGLANKAEYMFNSMLNAQTRNPFCESIVKNLNNCQINLIPHLLNLDSVFLVKEIYS